MTEEKKDRIKRFITCLIPVYACNFRCHYCYLSRRRDAYKGGIKPFVMPPEKIAEALSARRLGGVCYFNLCAEGETMLHPQMVDLVDCLTKEGHYCDIITNGSLKEKFVQLNERLNNIQKKHLFIKFSLHYLELKEKSLLDKFVENVNLIREAGISFSVEVTPSDELIPYIEELKAFCLQQFGAYPHITVGRDEGTREIALLSKYDKEEYGKIWSVFDSDLFDFKLSIFNQKRTEFCYAGLWSLWVNLENGCYAQCYKGDRLGNIKNLDKPIHLRPIGKCRQPHCFNGHAFLSLGNIPELSSPSYIAERDRITEDGTHWFDEDTACFFRTKLCENNPVFTKEEQRKILRRNKILHVINLGVKARDKAVRFYKRMK